MRIEARGPGAGTAGASTAGGPLAVPWGREREVRSLANRGAAERRLKLGRRRRARRGVWLLPG